MREGYKEKEAPLNKKVVDWLNTIESCRAVKRLGGPANGGQPDVTGSLHGIRIELEGKVGKNKLTDKQKYWLREWKAAGAITGVYWSLHEAKDIIFAQADKRGLSVIFK